MKSGEDGTRQRLCTPRRHVQAGDDCMRCVMLSQPVGCTRMETTACHNRGVCVRVSSGCVKVFLGANAPRALPSVTAHCTHSSLTTRAFKQHVRTHSALYGISSKFCQNQSSASSRKYSHGLFQLDMGKSCECLTICVNSSSDRALIELGARLGTPSEGTAAAYSFIS